MPFVRLIHTQNGIPRSHSLEDHSCHVESQIYGKSAVNPFAHLARLGSGLSNKGSELKSIANAIPGIGQNPHA